MKLPIILGILASLLLIEIASAAPLSAPCLETEPSSVQCNPVNSGNPMPVTSSPSSTAANGITPVVSAAAEDNHVLKNAAGNLYSVYAVNLTTTPGFLVVVNATSNPGDGAITPLDCAPLPASGSASINYLAGPPSAYSTGITAVITSSTTCFTKTTGVITGYISGRVK